MLSDRLREAPAAVRAAYGVAEPVPVDVGRRLGVVLELLRGVPAGVLSAREGVPEPELYRWRDAVLGGAAERIASAAAGRPSDEELEDWRRRSARTVCSVFVDYRLRARGQLVTSVRGASGLSELIRKRLPSAVTSYWKSTQDGRDDSRLEERARDARQQPVAAHVDRRLPSACDPAP